MLRSWCTLIYLLFLLFFLLPPQFKNNLNSNHSLFPFPFSLSLASLSSNTQQYTGDKCLWTANPGGQNGIQLVLDNGSNSLCGDGSPRSVTIAFVCPDAGNSGPLVPDSWTGVHLLGTCEYTYTFETCAACNGGCGGGPGPGPGPPGPPAPGPPAPGPPGPPADTSSWFVYLFFSVLILVLTVSCYVKLIKNRRTQQANNENTALLFSSSQSPSYNDSEQSSMPIATAILYVPSSSPSAPPLHQYPIAYEQTTS